MPELQIEDTEDINIQDETFRILDIGKLNWAFRKLTAIQAKEDEIKSLANAERDRIKQWEDKQLSSTNDSKEYLGNLVEEYHYRTLLEDPKAKTISTPYGKSKSRVSKAQPAKADDKALLDHILSNDMREFVKEDIEWGKIKGTLKIVEHGNRLVAIDSNGLIVPGVVIKPESISYTVEVT